MHGYPRNDIFVPQSTSFILKPLDIYLQPWSWCIDSSIRVKSVKIQGESKAAQWKSQIWPLSQVKRAWEIFLELSNQIWITVLADSHAFCQTKIRVRQTCEILIKSTLIKILNMFNVNDALELALDKSESLNSRQLPSTLVPVWPWL